MREAGVENGLLVIDNPSGPCNPAVSGPYTCLNIVPKLLASGARLWVFWVDEGGTLQSQPFVGAAA